ncbi:MAG: alpha/beta fold hydrolase [Anaerolineae bacterium]|nr:alpha/beta fold hydrolase [Anaerolineae bacterium]MCI0610034.1 alpha/beta fold hydrolase [Anaerolineae bacterium]
MPENITYALIHSPLVGPFTWQLVYQALIRQGIKAVIPTLVDDPDSTLPHWQQHVESVTGALALIPNAQKFVLVAHSGAGPLLPVICQKLTHQILAYIFVDAGIPRNGLSRIELMKLEDPGWAEQFHEALLKGEQFPKWTDDDLQEIIPDSETRRKLVTEIRPRSLSFFTELIPVPEGWPDAPCVYIQFSQSYNWDAAQAKQAGWDVYELNAGHFHMLVEPVTVADLIVKSLQKLLDASSLK